MGELADSPFEWLQVIKGADSVSVDELVVDLTDLDLRADRHREERIARMAIAREISRGTLILAPHWQEANGLRRRLFGAGPPKVTVRSG